MSDYTSLRDANAVRQQEWDKDDKITLSYRGNELAGETGEACNIIKKLERERMGIRGSRATTEQLADELADVVICSDLVAMAAGIDLDAAVVRKFNATSEKVGLKTRMIAVSHTESLHKMLDACGDQRDAALKERDEWKARAEKAEANVASRDAEATRENDDLRELCGATDGENGMAAAARVVRERDDAVLAARTAIGHRAKNIELGLVDPSQWRGPHGAPRPDDEHRWRVARVGDVDVLCRVFTTAGTDFWWAVGDFNRAREEASIDAACAAADEHVAGLARPERVFRFRVERDRDRFPFGDCWRCPDVSENDWGSDYKVAAKILSACGSTDRDLWHDFVLDHAALFRDGGTITEAEVRAWLGARGGK